MIYFIYSFLFSFALLLTIVCKPFKGCVRWCVMWSTFRFSTMPLFPLDYDNFWDGMTHNDFYRQMWYVPYFWTVKTTNRFNVINLFWSIHKALTKNLHTHKRTSRNILWKLIEFGPFFWNFNLCTEKSKHKFIEIISYQWLV